MAGAGLIGERRVVTALFCDVVGSTSIAENMDPEDWGELMTAAIDSMSTVVSRFGGTVTEFAGDGLVALFGAPAAHEDDPYRAARAGMEIVAQMGRPSYGSDQALDVRVGIHTGLVVVGDIGAGDLNTYSALGDTLNVASRLQAVARPGTVVVSRETRRLLGDDVEARELGPTELRGRLAPVVIYEVVDVKEAEERRRGLPGLESPMVGRRQELAILDRLVTMSAAGTGRVAAILGEAGVGKSRLLAEISRRSLRAEDEIWAVGTCVPFDDEVPYHLAASLLRSLAGVGASESPGVVAKAIDELADRCGAPDVAGTLKEMVGIDGEDEVTSEEDLREVYSRALVDVVSGLTDQTRLIVIACEDAHWADPSSVDLIADLLRRVPTMPILMLLVMRPDRDSVGWRLLEAGRRELAESLTEIKLEPLDEGSSRDLVSNLLAVESLPPTLRRLILDKAEGNPFFLEEVVRMLIERQLLENRDGRWVAVGDTPDLDVPETIEGLLASRVDLLDPELRRAGRVAATIGRRFAAHIFDMVYDGAPPDDERGSLHPHLAGLEAHGFVRLEEIEPELEFAFRHALIHEVMYHGLLRKERRELHRAVAEALESAHPDEPEEWAPSLARHYSEAGMSDRAVHNYLIAGRNALARGARVEASGFFAHAQELLEADTDSNPEDLIDAVIGRLVAGMAFIPGPESIRLVERILPIALELDDPDRLARLYERIIWTRGMQGETYADPQYRAQLDAGYALIPRLKDEGTSALLQAMMGGALRSGDDFDGSIQPLTEAVDALEAQGRLSEASYNAAMLADSLTQIGRFDEALSAVDRARDLGERSGDPNAVLDADIIRGSIAADKGDLEDAMEYTRRGIEGAEAHGNTFCNLAANFKLADQQLRLGDVDSAIAHLEKSTGLAQYCNAGGYEVLGQAWLAMARSRAGDLRPEDFDTPLAMAIESGSRSTEALVRLKRGVAMAAGGHIEEASSDFERAIELFADYGGAPNLARAHHAYGQALEASGREDEANSHLRVAEEIFSELGITPDPAGGN